MKESSQTIGNTAKISGDQLVAQEPELWKPEYGVYNHERMLHKLLLLEKMLTDEGLDVGADAEQSKVFLGRIFEEYESEALDKVPGGSFAFLVPPRIRRSVKGEHDPYTNEWWSLYPILRHVNSAIAQRFLVGTPPFIVDQYGMDDEGERGYMLFAPMFADMRADLRTSIYYFRGGNILQDAFSLASRLGVDTIGLGATLPKFLFMIDRHGRPVHDERLEITSGHAGTVWLIGETLRHLEAHGHKGREGRIGILGVGSIGVSTLAYLRASLGFEGDAHVYDRSATQLAIARSLDPRAYVAVDERELIAQSDTIICAATTTLELKKLGFNSASDLEGKVILDDSQPGCFDPAEVAQHGGRLVWIIGQDPTARGEITREWFDYSGSGPVRTNEIWGCELEAWAVKQHQRRAECAGSLAVRRPVTVQNVQRLGELLVEFGATTAPLQAGGVYLKH
jgi:hypothetical protein